MNVIFSKEDVEINTQFLRGIYNLDLENKIQRFERHENWERKEDKEMTLDKFIGFIPRNKFFDTKLFIGEDEFIPVRYSMNIIGDEFGDLFFEMHSDLTNKNYWKLQVLYFQTYKKLFNLY